LARREGGGAAAPPPFFLVSKSFDDLTDPHPFDRQVI